MSLLHLVTGVRKGPRRASGTGGMLLIMLALSGLLPTRGRSGSSPR
jgi:hypothetical protein